MSTPAPLRIFISFQSNQRGWAEWAATVLQQAGHKVDFQPRFDQRESFVFQIDQAIRQADRVLLLLSMSYFRSDWTTLEWVSIVRRSVSEKRGLICAVRLENITIAGLLGSFPYLDFVGRTVDEGLAEDLKRHVIAGAAPPLASELPSFVLGLKPASAPPPRNRLFFGRETELMALQGYLETAGHRRAIWLLKGVPGSGKTMIAIQFGHACLKTHHAVLWLDVRHAQTGADLLATLAEKFDDRGQVPTPERTTEWLQLARSWLIVLDGITSSSALSDWMALAPSTHGHTVVTSHLGGWENQIDTIEVKPWSPEISATFLHHCCPEAGGENETRELGLLLEGLPVALSQAASLAAETKLAYSEILDRLRRSGKVFGTCELSLEGLPSLSVELLEVLAWFSSAPMPRALIADAEFFGQTADDTGVLEIHRALGALERRSLLTLDPGRAVMHGFSSAAVRARISETELGARLKRALILARRWIDTRDAAGWSEVFPHVDAALRHAHARRYDSEEVIYLSSRLGLLCLRAGRNEESGRRLDATLEMTTRLRGDRHADTGAAAQHIGLQLRAEGRLSEAEMMFRRALELHSRKGASTAEERAVDHDALGLTLQQSGHFEEAEQHLRRALELVADASSVRRANQLNSLGYFLREQDRMPEAEPLIRQGLALVGGKTPFATLVWAALLENLGVLLRLTGRLKDAEQSYQNALALRTSRATEDERPRNLAICRTGLALVLMEISRMEEAEKLLQQAQEGQWLVRGSIDWISITSELAWLHTATDRFEEAAKEWDEIQDVAARTIPDGHWLHGHLLGRYGYLRWKGGDKAEAQAAFEKAAQILRTTLGPGHFRTRWVNQMLEDPR